MITPYNPLRGIDLYIDASGEDDWDVGNEKYYLHGLMLCGPSSEWINWMEIHKTKYDGMIHWSYGEFGKQKLKLEDVKGKCRQLIRMHPWFQTVIFAIDKKALKEFFLHKHGRKITKYEAFKSIWKVMPVSLLKTIMPHMKSLVPNDPWGCLNLRNVVINNPTRNKSIIEKTIKAEFGRTPEFVSAGHYGIDALDGVLWAFHRCLNVGKADCLPDSIQAFNKNLNIFIFGLASEKPLLLRNMNDINDFKNDE